MHRLALPSVEELLKIATPLAWRVTIRPGFPGHILFLGSSPGVLVVFQKSTICPGFCTTTASTNLFFGVLIGPASLITPSMEEFRVSTPFLPVFSLVGRA